MSDYTVAKTAAQSRTMKNLTKQGATEPSASRVAARSKAAARPVVQINRQSVVEYFDSSGHVYDRHIIDSYKNPKTVVALATAALDILARKDDDLTFSEVCDFVNEHVFNGSRGKWSTVRWNSKSYPD